MVIRMEIREVVEQEIKSDICNDILRALPAWFGIESSIIEYMEIVRSIPFYAAFDNEKPVGFLAVKVHNSYTAEVCVMGILNEYQRKRIGEGLMECAECFCVDHGYKFLTVKTLDSSVDFKPYERTRQFYSKMGFIPLEVFPLHWDKDNPCLFLAKYLG